MGLVRAARRRTPRSSRGEHPATYTYANIETQAESFRRYGVSFDWSRRLHTSDPDYYRWTQWLFLRFRERGLAYRKFSPVNWCPNDQTVLANEQVVQGMCERCGAEVTKRELSQWYFKVTDYAQRLLDDMEGLKEHVARPGAGHAAQLDRPLRGCATSTSRSRATGPRHGVHHPAGHAVRRDVLRRRCRRQAGRRAGDRRAPGGAGGVPGGRAQGDRHRPALHRPAKTGVFLGRYAVNPVNGERIPVWAADYVLADYGTGAVMAVPAHDQRDLDFAKAFGLPVRRVVDTGEDDPAETFVATSGDGTYVSSGRAWTGSPTRRAA